MKSGKKFLSLLMAFSWLMHAYAQTGLEPFRDERLRPFYYGVASFDPLPDGIILWTHVTPDQAGPAVLEWRIARDTGFTQLVLTSSVNALPENGYTAQVEVQGLSPDTWYYYDFTYNGMRSLVGRTHTAPSGNNSRLRLGVLTCADYKDGWFNAYARVAQRNDVDAIVHLGDYIYESASDGNDVRQVFPPVKVSTTDEYRTRYAFYRLDPALRAAHQQYPWISIWDDHEVRNDCWAHGAGSTDSLVYENLKKIGLQVNREWVPKRYPDPSDSTRIYRKMSLGNLADLMLLDTRHEGRTPQVDIQNPLLLNDTTRRVMSDAQYDWLFQQWDSSNARWQLIGQQIVVAPFTMLGAPLPGSDDIWNGYPIDRQRFLGHFQGGGKSTVILTGDLHNAVANDLPLQLNSYDTLTGAGSVAVELVTPAICGNTDGFSIDFEFVKRENPFCYYTDFTQRGYMILTLSPDTAQADFYFVNTLLESLPEDYLAESVYTLHGTNHLRYAAAEALAGNYPIPAPYDSAFTVLGIPENRAQTRIYPNPAADELLILSEQPLGNISLWNANGQLLAEYETRERKFSISMINFDHGMYYVRIRNSVVHKIVK